MARAKYSLDPLVRLRDAHVDDQAEALARAARAREEAEAARMRADEERKRAAEAAATRRAREAEALARGELKVADLVRANAWEHRVASDDAALREKVARAAEAEAAARTTEGDARVELGRRKVDADVVHEHEARWKAEEQRAAEAREEEAAEEAWRRK